MPTLFDRLEAGLDTGALDSVLGEQVGQLGQVVSLVADLADHPPSSIGDFAAQLASLTAPGLPNGQSVTGSLTAASGALPTDFSAATGGAVAEIRRFTELVSTQLVPLLGNAVAVARAVETLGGAEFRCPPEPVAGVPPPPPPPPPPGTSAGADRLAAATEQSAQVAALLDALPTPLTAGSLIEGLVQLSDFIPSGLILPAIPLLDDIILPVRTLAVWSGMSAADLGANLHGTLILLRDRIRAAGPDRLAAAAAAAMALRTPLRPTELDAFLTEYLTQAAAMAAALEADDPVSAALHAADLDTAVAGFETLRATMAADFTALVPVVARGLAAAPGDMLDQLLHLVVQLEPLNPGALLTEVQPPVPAPPEELQAFRDVLAPIIDFLEDLTGLLDFSALEGGVATVAAEAQAIAGRVRDALNDVVIDVRAAFAQVEAAVAGIGLDALAAEMRAAIAQAGEAIETAIADAFTPLRNALTAAIDTISDAVDTLDFAAVTDALADAVGQVTAILQDSAVTGAVEEIRTLLQEVTEVLSQLSFASVIDEVIALIEQMEQGLRALQSTDLNEALKGLLETALAVLPPDLRPVTDPIIDDFGVRLDQGPVALLESVRSKPGEILDRIRFFDPGALIGETLAGPFNEAKAKLDDFRPSTLLAPLSDELARQKVRLKAEAAPSRALAPLVTAFDGLLAQIDRLSPDAIIGPLEEAVESAIQDAVDASPIDEIFAEINGIFATVQGVLDTVTSIGTTVRKLGQALTALQDSDAQIDAWRDGILAKIDTAPKTADLNSVLGEIHDVVDATRHADLLAGYDAAVAPLVADLTDLTAGEQLSAMVALHQRLRPLVQALPAGPPRSAIEAVVARFDPLNPAHTGGLRAASDLAAALSAGRAALTALQADFSGPLHGPGAGLTVLREAATDAGGLRAIVAADVDGALMPVRYLLAKLRAAAVPVGGVAQSLADLEARLTTSLANILTGPASLQSISDAVQSEVNTLRNVDLGFLRESLEGVFRTVRQEIESLGPKPLILALDREFGEIIDALDLDVLLPPAEVAALDAAAATVAEKLGALDPARLATDAVGPAFEADVLPLIEALDITPVFDRLIEALRGLDEELKSEFARVNTAYQALLAARPAGVGASAGAGF